MKTFNELTGLYSLSKTLRFELKPVGKTLANIEAKGVITKDEQRAEEYKKVKDIIDRYHKTFIDMCLSNLVLKTNSDGSNDSLEDYIHLASKQNRNEQEDKNFDNVKTSLRKQIVSAFKKGAHTVTFSRKNSFKYISLISLPTSKRDRWSRISASSRHISLVLMRIDKTCILTKRNPLQSPTD